MAKVRRRRVSAWYDMTERGRVLTPPKSGMSRSGNGGKASIIAGLANCG
jgi:hypothetical protein